MVERFWDQKDLRGRNGGRAVGDFPKPSDFLVCQDGAIHFAEVKSVTGKTSFPFANIKPKQRATAITLSKLGMGHLYIFYIFSFGLGQWFVMNGDDLLMTIENGRSSTKFKDLPQWK